MNVAFNTIQPNPNYNRVNHIKQQVSFGTKINIPDDVKKIVKVPDDAARIVAIVKKAASDGFDYAINLGIQGEVILGHIKVKSL